METPNTYWDLFFGYGAIWAILAIFLIRLRSEQSALARRLAELEARSSQPTESKIAANFR